MSFRLSLNNMRKSLLYIVPLMAFALSSCSDEDSPAVSKDGIRYNVVTEDATRAADAYGTARRPSEFYVWANIVGETEPYFSDNRVEYSLGGWTDTDGMKYWPQGKALNFFAHVNGESSFDFNGGKPQFVNFEVKENVSEQVDLMYAVSSALTNNGEAVTLTFRHALAMVSFAASNSMTGINLEISSIEVCNLANKGTFSFSDSEWDVVKDYTHAFTAGMNASEAIVLTPGGETVNLTGIAAGAVNPAKNVMMLMPQKVAAWNPQGASSDGAYVRMYIKVISADDNGVLTQGYSIAPLDVDWEAGGSYTYTLSFKDGSSVGYTNDLENPQPFYNK